MWSWNMAHAANADSFRTPEYQASAGLESLNAAEAYALGFTGKGVVVGVIDSPFAQPTGEFLHKYPYGWESIKDPYPHGIHVAGIIAARKNDIGMHGVAFDAKLVPRTMNDVEKALESILRYPEARIISNSWGTDIYPDQSPDFGPATPFADYPYAIPGMVRTWSVETLAGIRENMQLAVDEGRLMVFAAGNMGHLSGGGEAVLPSIDALYAQSEAEMDAARRLSLSWLNIAAYDPAWHTPQSYDPARGLSPAFPAAFTSMALHAERYTLWAPGVRIYSTISPTDYRTMSGTSMAAPYVAGVAALVQSAFPYMDGKQLADTLLSTATPFSLDGAAGTVRPPGVFLLNREEYDANNEMHAAKIVYALEGHTASEAEKEAMVAALRVFYASTKPDAEIAGMVDEALKNIVSLPPQDYLGLFGAGIVDAGKAVRGPGRLDAWRLDNADRLSFGGVDYALYSVDTQGCDSVWGNAIAQVPVDAALSPDDPLHRHVGALAGLDVGLRKQGPGTLTLTGANSYLGPTVAEGGGLALGLPGQPEGGARLAGDVYVLPGAVLSGNGQVDGNLAFSGALSPGFVSEPGSALRVDGSVIGRHNGQSGEWRLVLGEKGQANTLRAAGTVDIDGVRFSVPDRPGYAPALAGRYVILESAGVSGTPAVGTLDILQGSTLASALELTSEQGRTLYAVHKGSKALPQAKALAEGYTGGVALAVQGADIIAGQGLDAAALSAGQSLRPAGFGLAAGGDLRYSTGSRLNLHSVNLLTGLAQSLELSPGLLTAGVFFEYGNGRYETHNSVAGAASVAGDGTAYYIGGGLLGRLDLRAAGPGRLYFEGSARAGKVHNEYESDDLRDAVTGVRAEYDSAAAYYGLHFGAGYLWRLSQAVSLDLYGKYFWLRQEGDSALLSSGEHLRFGSVDSHRLRFGGRISYVINPYFAPYVGAAWEHEFEARVRAWTNGSRIAAPDLRGDVGIAEIGVSLRPSAAVPLHLDLVGQGYTGEREGVAGSIQLRFEF
jgi:autotransporter-associated beta strand protein